MNIYDYIRCPIFRFFFVFPKLHQNTLLSSFSLKGRGRCHFQGGKRDKVEYSNNFWFAYWPTFHNKNRRFAKFAILRFSRIAESQLLHFENRRIANCAILRFTWIANRIIVRFCDSRESQNRKYLRFCDSRESQNRTIMRFAIHVNRRIAQFAILRFSKCNNCDSAILENLRIANLANLRFLLWNVGQYANQKLLEYSTLSRFPPWKWHLPLPFNEKDDKRVFWCNFGKTKKNLNMGQRM